MAAARPITFNCPFNKEEYEAFHAELIAAERAPLHDFDGDLTVYEGRMPIEVMAARGADTIRFGPLRPVGLRDPAPGTAPWAAVQLRAENTARTLYNLVGFQTNLKWGEQKRVFSMIPGLEHAEFVRYGVMHRNTFLKSPSVLTRQQFLKEHPNVFFAGQITGFEGYMESAASGLLAARQILARLQGRELPRRPPARCVARCWIISPRPTRTSSPWARTWASCPAPKKSTPSAISASATPLFAERTKRHARMGGGIQMKILVDAMGGDNAPLCVCRRFSGCGRVWRRHGAGAAGRRSRYQGLRRPEQN